MDYQLQVQGFGLEDKPEIKQFWDHFPAKQTTMRREVPCARDRYIVLSQGFEAWGSLLLAAHLSSFGLSIGSQGVRTSID